MPEQMGTPGSTADTSVNGGKTGAPKDKACPFCGQQFTSSSLGRHLDLYIKEKNPKPADGIHNVVEIRKMRGGITRRQPRNSASRREDSTPVGTPGAQDMRSPRPESDRLGNRSPSLARNDGGPSELMNYGRGKANLFINRGTWESTGVMNNIPPPKPADSRSWDGDDRDGGRRLEPRSRSVSKQMLAKTTFEQKQKMLDALDNARAAELALRELLGSIRSAKNRLEGPDIFDYDPLSLDFPALTLHCLPPPPTLYSSVPVASSSSWSVAPPDDAQYQALREHFSAAFHRWRISCAIATTAPGDDLSYPPPANYDDPNDVTQQAEADAAELESKISEHLHSVYAQWNGLPPAKRSEIWTLEFARGVGRKSREIETLKKEKEFKVQETAHLQLQIDELSRLQHPREFKITPPTTIPMDGQLITRLGELGVQHTSGVGFTLMDRNVHLDTVVERAIGRWKEVVKEARGGGGLSAQRPLSGESNHTLPTLPQSTTSTPNPSININRNHHDDNNSTTTNGIQGPTNGDMGMGSDQDADADMEEDDSYVEMTDVQPNQQRGAPEASMSNSPAATNFRLSNVNGGGNGRMEGMENQVVQGYVRIGA